METAYRGHTDIAITLLKAKANINVKDILVSPVGWCRGWAPFGVECAGAKMEIDVEGVLLQCQPCRWHFNNHDDTVVSGCDGVGEK